MKKYNNCLPDEHDWCLGEIVNSISSNPNTFIRIAIFICSKCGLKKEVEIHD